VISTMTLGLNYKVEGRVRQRRKVSMKPSILIEHYTPNRAWVYVAGDHVKFKIAYYLDNERGLWVEKPAGLELSRDMYDLIRERLKAHRAYLDKQGVEAEREVPELD
jgi:hypothetical protein